MTDHIPAEAIEAAARAIQSAHVPVTGEAMPGWESESEAWRKTYRDFARAALSAALPFLRPAPSESKVDHDHRPVQHRDGREPWCKVCGLNPAYEEPRSRFTRRPMPSREQVAQAAYETTRPDGIDLEEYPWARVKEVDSCRRYWRAADAVLALFKGGEG